MAANEKCGGGGDRGGSDGKGREEGTGQIFLRFAAEGVEIESVAGADQERDDFWEKEGEREKKKRGGEVFLLVG
ncbi:hypothetical protein L873DRAFT_1809587 [Choiromyces venosus 120613-1]|uniref:Uncharacterized protein n=1 Tax=Choiromyces venosus 120613-1 TaxID=1336337 RepID=A0A3N4JGY7_9PEZI|nr:hypothetical protein L873DRAFT_1809587 [Choiromyces venosus 120613-1]